MELSADYDTYRYRVPSIRIGRLRERIEALSKKAEKLGMPPFTLDISDDVMVKDLDHPGRYDSFNDVTLTGGVAMLEGWRFVAKIEHDDIMNMVRGFGAQSLIDEQPKLFEKLTTCPPKCEHCNVNRNRNTTYLFADKEDRTKQIQVGSTCVADFSGHKDPALLLSVAAHFQSVIQELSDPDHEPGGGFSAPIYDLQTVVAAAAAVVRTEGRWVSRDEADPTIIPTADHVSYLLSKPKAFNKLVTAGDERNAKAAVEWLSDDNFDNQGQLYLVNLQALARRKYIDKKNLGLGASAFIAHKRHIEKATKKQEERESFSNTKLGKEGERLELNVRVDKIIPIDTEFGISRLHLMRDLDSDARVTWFNSGNRKFFEGDTYSIKGRVKKHTEREGVMQTQLSRVTSPDIKIQDELAEYSRYTGDISTDTIKKLLKQITKATNLDCRNGDGYTISMAACRVFDRCGEQFRPLVEAVMNGGHDLSIPCPEESANAFDYLVTSGATDLIESALKANQQLAESWDKDHLETFGVESEDILTLLAEYRGDDLGTDFQQTLKMA
jgi:hypothetical protein